MDEASRRGVDRPLKEQFWGVNVGRHIVTNATLLHSCVKVHEAIALSFGVVSGVSPGIGVDDFHILRWKGGFGGCKCWGFLSIGLNSAFQFICERETYSTCVSKVDNISVRTIVVSNRPVRAQAGLEPALCLNRPVLEPAYYLLLTIYNRNRYFM